MPFLRPINELHSPWEHVSLTESELEMLKVMEEQARLLKEKEKKLYWRGRLLSSLEDVIDFPASYHSSPLRSPSPSPTQQQSSSPAGQSPTQQRSSSPAGHRSPSPTQQRSSSPARHRSPSPTQQRSSSPAGHRSPSPTQQRFSSPARHRSPSPTQQRSSSPAGHRSPSPTQQRFSSPTRHWVSPQPGPSHQRTPENQQITPGSLVDSPRTPSMSRRLFFPDQDLLHMLLAQKKTSALKSFIRANYDKILGYDYIIERLCNAIKQYGPRSLDVEPHHNLAMIAEALEELLSESQEKWALFDYNMDDLGLFQGTIFSQMAGTSRSRLSQFMKRLQSIFIRYKEMIEMLEFEVVDVEATAEQLQRELDIARRYIQELKGKRFRHDVNAEAEFMEALQMDLNMQEHINSSLNESNSQLRKLNEELITEINELNEQTSPAQQTSRSPTQQRHLSPTRHWSPQPGPSRQRTPENQLITSGSYMDPPRTPTVARRLFVPDQDVLNRLMTKKNPAVLKSFIRKYYNKIMGYDYIIERICDAIKQYGLFTSDIEPHHNVAMIAETLEELLEELQKKWALFGVKLEDLGILQGSVLSAMVEKSKSRVSLILERGSNIITTYTEMIHGLTFKKWNVEATVVQLRRKLEMIQRHIQELTGENLGDDVPVEAEFMEALQWELNMKVRMNSSLKESNSQLRQSIEELIAEVRELYEHSAHENLENLTEIAEIAKAVELNEEIRDAVLERTQDLTAHPDETRRAVNDCINAIIQTVEEKEQILHELSVRARELDDEIIQQHSIVDEFEEEKKKLEQCSNLLDMVKEDVQEKQEKCRSYKYASDSLSQSIRELEENFHGMTPDGNVYLYSTPASSPSSLPDPGLSNVQISRGESLMNEGYRVLSKYSDDSALFSTYPLEYSPGRLKRDRDLDEADRKKEEKRNKQKRDFEALCEDFWSSGQFRFPHTAVNLDQRKPGCSKVPDHGPYSIDTDSRCPNPLEHINLPQQEYEHDPIDLPRQSALTSIASTTASGSPLTLPHREVPEEGPSRMVDSPLHVKHTSQFTNKHYTDPYISPKKSRFNYTDPTSRMLNATPGPFQPASALQDTVVLTSPKRQEPLLVNIVVDPKPLTETESGEHFVCDITLDVPQEEPSRMVDSSLHVKHTSQFTNKHYTDPYISPKKSRFNYTDPTSRMLSATPGPFQSASALQKMVALTSPKRQEPLLVNIGVDPKPLTETESGEHFVCDITLDVPQAGPSEKTDSPLPAKHTSQFTNKHYTHPFISPKKSRFNYTDPNSRILNVPLGRFQSASALQKTVALTSPKRQEPLLVNIGVAPKPLTETESGEHFICDISLDVQPTRDQIPYRDRNFRRVWRRLPRVFTRDEPPAVTPTSARRQDLFTPRGIFKRRHYNIRRVHKPHEYQSPNLPWSPHGLPDIHSPISRLNPSPIRPLNRTMSWEKIPESLHQSPVTDRAPELSPYQLAFERSPPSVRDRTNDQSPLDNETSFYRTAFPSSVIPDQSGSTRDSSGLLYPNSSPSNRDSSRSFYSSSPSNRDSSRSFYSSSPSNRDSSRSFYSSSPSNRDGSGSFYSSSPSNRTNDESYSPGGQVRFQEPTQQEMNRTIDSPQPGPFDPNRAFVGSR